MGRAAQAPNNAHRPAQREAGAERTDGQPDAEQDQRGRGEGQRADVGRRLDVAEDRRQRELLAEQQSRIAASDPAAPQSRPSSMNGPRTNQFVAPTSFITSISRRRAKIESRIVFAISSVDAIRSTITATRKITWITRATCRMRWRSAVRP